MIFSGISVALVRSFYLCESLFIILCSMGDIPSCRSRQSEDGVIFVALRTLLLRTVCRRRVVRYNCLSAAGAFSKKEIPLFLKKEHSYTWYSGRHISAFAQSAVPGNPRIGFISPGILWRSWNMSRRLSSMISVRLLYCAGIPIQGS